MDIRRVMRKLPLVEVEWDDTLTIGTWHDEKDDFSDHKCHCFSVGWRKKGMRNTITLITMRSPDHDGETSCNNIQIIPRGCVTKIRRIE